jgi:hypothetical protein
MSYSFDIEYSSEESTGFHSANESGIITPTAAMATGSTADATEMAGVENTTQAPPPLRTLRDAYRDLAVWLDKPEQQAQFQNQTLLGGPIAPPGNSEIWYNMDMLNTVVGTFYRGSQAVSDSSIQGPEKPAETPSEAVPLLWSYYNQGFRCATESKYLTSGAKTEVVKPSSMKLPDPEPFKGNRDELEGFIRTLHVKFNMEKERFPNDIQKIAFASSFLAKDAKVWFNPYVDKDTGKIAFDTYSEFLADLRKSFGDPNRIATAEFLIEKLKQTGSLDLYYAKFKELMDVLEWNDNQRVYRFRLGLKDDIKDLLISRGQYTNEKDFERMYTNAREAENDLNIRSQEVRNTSGSTNSKSHSKSQNNQRSYPQPSKSNSKSNYNSTAYGTHSGPMDLNAAPKKFSKPNKTYSKLSKEEKSLRFKKGQCFYCKAEGHYASDCPVSKAKAEKQGNWKKPDNRKALVANTENRNEEKGKVIYSLGGKDNEESKN